MAVHDRLNSQILTVVAAALVDAKGRVLIQQRPAGRAMAGLWEFPGGKIEDGETPEAALVRELREELAIEIDPDSLMPAAFASEPLGERHLLLLLFLCRDWRGTPRAVEAAELRWLHPADLRALDMPPADLPLIRLLERVIQAP